MSSTANTASTTRSSNRNTKEVYTSAMTMNKNRFVSLSSKDGSRAAAKGFSVRQEKDVLKPRVMIRGDNSLYLPTDVISQLTQPGTWRVDNVPLIWEGDTLPDDVDGSHTDWAIHFKKIE